METSFNVKAGIFNFHQRCSGMSMDIAQYLHMLVVAKGHNIMRSQQTIATTVGYLDYLWLREQYSWTCIHKCILASKYISNGSTASSSQGATVEKLIIRIQLPLFEEQLNELESTQNYMNIWSRSGCYTKFIDWIMI